MDCRPLHLIGMRPVAAGIAAPKVTTARRAGVLDISIKYSLSDIIICQCENNV